MRRSSVVLLLLAVAATTARPAEVATAVGDKAMFFKFTGLSNLGLEGYLGGLGLRFYVKDRLALRPSFSFGWSNRRTHPPAVEPGQPRASNEREINTDAQFELALEKHLAGPNAISPYLGAGISGTHYDHKVEPSVLPGSPPGTVTKTTNCGTNGSLFGMFGFEWGWTQSMTLGAETRFGLTVLTGKLETEAVQTPDRLSNDVAQYSVGFDTAALFLSARW